ncbi:MAG: hypothetical protein CL908_08740 [Deltaproteobacteria bacterium]|nr:hypothetical protein [Deltaproteobacteria bacterium]
MIASVRLSRALRLLERPNGSVPIRADGDFSLESRGEMAFPGIEGPNLRSVSTAGRAHSIGLSGVRAAAGLQHGVIARFSR